MKKLVMLAFAMLLGSRLFAQMNEIRGTVGSDYYHDQDIALYSIEDGEPVELAKTKLAQDGSFGFLFTPAREGFYAIGWADFVRGKFPIYFKKGDKAEVSIYNRTMQFVGKQTPENTILSSWTQLTESLKNKSFYFASNSTFRDFFPEFTKVAAKTDDFRKTINTKNVRFNELMKEVTVYDMDLYALNFMRTPRIEYPKNEDLIPYYNSIVAKDKFNNDDVLLMLYGKRYMGMYADYAVPGRSTLDNKLAAFNSDKVKGAYILNSGFGMKGVKNYAGFKEIVDKYGNYFQSEYQKKTLEELSSKYYSAESGTKPAADFTYPDQNDKMVSLSDFKGKVVLVDVWATWCGPCNQEIPSLKNLEKELQGKDVVFISVSLDEEKDKQKWKTMLKEKELDGVQLLASGFNTKIAKDYKIEAIPRFMVFDKKGNVVTIDAPRPSNPKLKELLLSELNNNSEAALKSK
ncbi:TlpA family protein disulfide reductase [Solitalea koreensis]|uniref:Thiol-disulfide isomerase or thioredoxin n=1 Tax=Solitalea koreensis TaxID=543615 RepID=A0A521CAC6_9SPHI|nr:TlpA disulfide reductase family protein [Solitalea koreensis]SMO56356.1 Thiol-disulfide isomerase or thioredoxin [Solitalea koreensis]